MVVNHAYFFWVVVNHDKNEIIFFLKKPKENFMECEKRRWVIVVPKSSSDLREKIRAIAQINGRQVGAEVQKILEKFVEDNSTLLS